MKYNDITVFLNLQINARRMPKYVVAKCLELKYNYFIMSFYFFALDH